MIDAIFCYNIAAQVAFQDYYVNTLGSLFAPGDPRCQWECDRRRLDSGHKEETFSPPFDHVERVWHEETKVVTDDAFVKYLTTQSAYQGLLRKNPNHDPLQKLKHVLAADNGKRGGQLKVVFPFWLIIGSKPGQKL